MAEGRSYLDIRQDLWSEQIFNIGLKIFQHLCRTKLNGYYNNQYGGRIDKIGGRINFRTWKFILEYTVSLYSAHARKNKIN